MDNNTEYSIAQAVWEGKIDGWDTRTVAEHFEITTPPQALRVLKKIASDKNTDFPFEHRDDYKVVTVKDERIFVWGENAEYMERKGKRHHIWFYT